MRTQLRSLGRAVLTLALATITGTVLHGQLVAPTELVSVTTTGVAGGITFADFSFFDAGLSNITTDNRYVVFSTASALVAGTNGVQQVFVRDRQTGVTTLVSRASDGTLGNLASGDAVISANARYVAFTSAATNLVAGDTNDGDDIFVRDLLMNTTVRASVSSGGVQAISGVNRLAPAISGDGRLVVFSSTANNLVPGDTNVSNSDVFVRDLVAGTTARVSVRPGGSEIVGSDSLQPSISADGHRVAFAVFNNTLAGPTPQVPPNLAEGIYVRDLVTSATILVSALPDGTPAHLLLLGQQFPMMSANGRYVSFNSWDDLDPAFPDSIEERNLFDGVLSDVFVRDLDTSTTRRASMPFPGGAAEESGSMATISADGRFVAYINSQNVTVVRDMITNTSVMAQLPDASFPDVSSPRLSPDARLLFVVSATDIDASDTNNEFDAYLFTLPLQGGSVVTWPVPANIVYGTALGSTQLNATANVPGTFVYSPPSGTVLHAGNAQTLSLSFTPNDTVHYNVTTASVLINVQTAPLIVAANNANKVFGAPLPAFSPGFAGFVNGDGPGSLGGALVLSTTATATSPAGPYPIVPSGLTSFDYTISFVPGTLTISQAATTTTAFALPSPNGFLQPDLLAALVSPVAPGAGSPDGVVQFKDGATVIGSASVTGGIAYIIANGLLPGAHAITAVYAGSSNFTGSGSTPAPLTVLPVANSTFTLVGPLTNPQAAGQPASFAALVLPLGGGSVSGTVQFTDGGTVLGTASVNASGIATFSTSTLGVGLHSIGARYLGRAGLAASAAVPALQTIYTGTRPAATTTILSTAPSPSTLGQAVALTGAVTGGATVGDVNFYADGVLLGHAPLANVGGTFQATLNVSTLPLGIHVMSASYVGSIGFAASNTPPAGHVVQ